MFKKVLASFLICLSMLCPLTLSACKKKNNNSDPGTPPGTTTPVPGVPTEPAANPLVSISIDGELKDEFYKGEQLNIEGISITLTYQDTTTSTIVLSNDMVSGFDSSTVGEHTLTITYDGKTTTHPYTVREVQATNIEIETPFKTNYYTGSALNVENGEIKVTYEDGTNETLVVSADMISDFDSSTAGEYKMTLTYAGYSVEIDYIVSDAQITSVSINTQFKTTYFAGDSLNLNGGSIVARYEDGNSEILPITSAMVGETFNSTTAGSKIMTITYKGKSVEVPYKINAVEATGISLESTLDKVEYLEGETLDVTGGKIKVSYNNGTTQIVDITAAMTSGFNSTYVNSNQKTLIITYLGFTTSLKYSVVQVVVTSLTLTHTFKTTYFKYEPINVAGGLLTATYSNGTTEENIVLTTDMISEFYADTVGTATMYITYKTFSIECEYTILAVELESIAVKTNPTKTTYYVGDSLQSLDLTGCVITLYYNNGTTETILATDGKVTPTGFYTYKTGDRVITLTYKGFTTTVAYSVIEKPAATPDDTPAA